MIGRQSPVDGDLFRNCGSNPDKDRRDVRFLHSGRAAVESPPPVNGPRLARPMGTNPRTAASQGQSVPAASTATAAAKPAASSASKRATSGLSRSNTATSRSPTTTGSTSSEFEAESQAM
jgi:hypothetical protein